MNTIEYIKALIRPLLITWGVTFYTVCVLKEIIIPQTIEIIILAIIIEYFGERAIKRLIK